MTTGSITFKIGNLKQVLRAANAWKKKTTNLQKKAEDKRLNSNKEYESTLAELKSQIRESQVRAIAAANRELILLYWKIGKTLIEK